ELARGGERALRNTLERGVERTEVAIADLRGVLRGGVDQEAPDVETELVERREELVLEERRQRAIGEEGGFVDERDRPQILAQQTDERLLHRPREQSLELSRIERFLGQKLEPALAAELRDVVGLGARVADDGSARIALDQPGEDVEEGLGLVVVQEEVDVEPAQPLAARGVALARVELLVQRGEADGERRARARG